MVRGSHFLCNLPLVPGASLNWLSSRPSFRKIMKNELVKMILKNIKPYLASQLHSHVSTVDELVKLGRQLEKDSAQQLHYEKRITQPTPPQRLTSNRPVDKPLVQCWRCKGHHPPGNCPHYSTIPLSPVSLLISILLWEVKSSQVTFIYIALLTIQIVSKHLTVSSWRTECQ